MIDYELGVMKVIPIHLHLMADYLAGAFLVASPWLFRFSDASSGAMVTAVVMGVFVIGSTLMTQPRGRPRQVMA